MNRSLFANIALIISGIFIASNLYTMIPLQKLLSDSYHIPVEYSSLASFCFIIFYSFGLLFFGILADRMEERSIIVYGMLTVSLLTLTLTIASNFVLFLGIRSLQGFAASTFAPAAFSYVFRFFDLKTRTIAIALINTGFLFAGIFGQMISAYLAFQYTFHAVFYGFSLFYFICFLYLWITLKKGHKPRVEQHNLLTHILTLIRYSPLQKLYGISFFLLFTVMLFYGGFEVYMIHSEGEMSLSLQMFRFIGLIGITPAFFARPLQRTWGAHRVLRYSLLLMSAGLLPSFLFFDERSLIISSIALIASTSLTIPMVILLVGQYGTDARGRAIALYSFTLLAGAGIGSLLSAVIPFPIILIGCAVLYTILANLSHSIQKQEESGGMTIH